MRLLSLIVLCLSLSSTGCTTNKATGRTQLDFGMDQQQEISLGSEAAPVFLKDNGGEIPSPAILAYIRDIGARLAAQSERPDLPWEFHCLDSSQINAFALPGGKVFFSRGLLAKLPNEAAVAAVMGHEVGHVTAKHINERMAQGTLLSGVLTAVGAAGQVSDSQWLQVLGAGGQVGGSLYLLKFGRDQESEADRLGIRYMANLGYNPVGMMQVMEILKAASGGGGGGFEQILSTHPNPEARYKDAEKLIKKNYPDFNDTGKYSFQEDRFKQVVLANLARLPKPKHTAMAPRPEQAPLAAAAAPDAAPVSIPASSNGTPASPDQPPVSSALAKAIARMHQLGNCACHLPPQAPQAVVDAEDRR